MRIMLFAMTLGLSLCASHPAPKPDSDAAPRQSSAATTLAVIRGRATYLERSMYGLPARLRGPDGALWFVTGLPRAPDIRPPHFHPHSGES